MPLFQAVRRYKKWPVRLPLHDGRECPDCAAIITGNKGQELHRAYHEAMWQFQEQTIEAIRQTATGAGLLAEHDLSGGEADGLDLYDDEEHDSRRRRVPWRIAMMTRDEDDDGGEDDDDADA
jgi:hypothetical protein